ncbi:MAG TPA: ABC transporter, partial [Erysipelotrichaceae bacterium]|nr:ABC transporter [Erysipelotrichaceae bacterium]
VTILIYFSMKISYPRFYQLQKAMDQVNSKVQEYLIGVRLVKAFGTFGKETDKFHEANQNLMQKGIASQMVITIISPLLTLAVGIGTAVVIYIGSSLFTMNLANTGDITAFTIYMAQILTSLIMITNVFTMFVRTKASTARIGEVFDCEEDCLRSNENRKLSGKITFENVTFAYPNGSGVPAIKDLSFSVNSGESLAIIGPTGSGKSTITWLLLRFYDVDRGKIILDNYDITMLGADEVRSNVAVVPQKPMLFSGSVADNLKWGDKLADIDELRHAAEKAQADFIMQMPDGYDSILGSDGVNLSGGQKQRLSIARALVRKPDIYVFDDSFSALDFRTDATLRKELKKETGDAIVMVVAQRISSIMEADRIVVLNEGNVIGTGTHRELLKNCEIYKEIALSQLSEEELAHE